MILFVTSIIIGTCVVGGFIGLGIWRCIRYEQKLAEYQERSNLYTDEEILYFNNNN